MSEAMEQATGKMADFIESWSDCLIGVQMDRATFQNESGLPEYHAAVHSDAEDDEITRLRAENKMLVEALEDCVERMQRARRILRESGARELGIDTSDTAAVNKYSNWGMLDTAKPQKALAKVKS